MEALTTKEVAERLSVHPNTIGLWESKLGVQPEMDSRGRKRFPPGVVAVLEQIKALRDEDAGYQTIRRKLSLDDVSHIEATQDDNEPNDAAHHQPMGATSPAAMKMLEMLQEKDRQIAELQEKLRDVSSIAAQYQERSGNLAAELGRKSEEIKLLMAPKEEEAPQPWWRFWG